MKKAFLIKYLPIAIALVLLFAMFITLNVYNSNFAEYAVVSVSVAGYEIDLTVSKSLTVIKIETISHNAFVKSEDLAEVENMKVDDAVAFIKENFAGNETLFLASTADEESEIELEELKSISEKATKKLTDNYVFGYAQYKKEDVTRVNTVKCGLGKVAWYRNFAEYCHSKTSIYIDTYSQDKVSADQLAFYVNYLKDNVFEKDGINEIHINVSKAEYGFTPISEEKALQNLIDTSETWYGEEVSDFSNPMLVLSFGTLRYRFITQVYGYESYAFCDIVSGATYFDEDE